MQGIDWNTVGAEVTAHLQALIRIDTTNPPGNETAAARYLASVLEKEGFAAEITESAPGRGNVTTRWPGGGEPPLLLLGHTDVVAADAGAWTHPPFGGEIHDGYVWGRGALDMKNMVAAELMVMLLLKRQGLRLNRDVMFAATADEEAGKGGHGPGWLLDHHPAGIEAPVVLTEGGGHEVRLGGRRFTTCQVGQKGICRLRATARGRPGHGSVPQGDNAVLTLAAALAPLRDCALPVHPCATLRTFFEAISRGRPQLRTDLLALLDPERSEAALARLPLDDAERAGWGALLRNTASVTMLAAGSGINIIPAEATAWIDGRLAPGQTQQSFLAELRAVVGEELDLEVDQYSPPLEAEAAGVLYDTIAAVMARHEPEAPLVPVLSTGGTDAKHIVPRRPGTQVYGFMPYRQQAGSGELGLLHGHDERTSIDELLFATRIIYEIVCTYGGIQA